MTEAILPTADPAFRGQAEDIVEPKISLRNVSVAYGDNLAINNVSLDIADNSVTALIGPSGCGKSTLLKCINRMNETVDDCHVAGEVRIDGEDIMAPGVDPVLIRARVGMVFQEPNPFPKTIFDNVAYGPRIHGFVDSKAELEQIVQTSLQRAGLWDEVRDSLHRPGTALSGGQQQRLVIARAIAIDPEIILMDEPCSALDPIATARIEELIDELRQNYCIVIVTHSMSQAARISQYTTFLDRGRLIERGTTEQIFTRPQDRRTHDYITGRYG